MMYSELLVLTNNKATYDEFLVVEKVYMESDTMTKKQAAELWSRLYESKNRPLAKELKQIREAIRNLKENREIVEFEIQKIKENYEKKISDLNLNPDDYFDRQIINRLKIAMNQDIYRRYDTYGNDTTIFIIYKDGSECSASGIDIVSGEITPKMQNIAYASYLDAWTEYDTEMGCLDELWDLTTDEGVIERQNYFNMIQNKY